MDREFQKANIKVLFFATARDITGIKETKINVPKTLSSEELNDIIVKNFGLESIQRNIILALNQEFIADNVKLQLCDRDEVAVIPPLSGGNDNMEEPKNIVKLQSNKLRIDEIIDLVTSPSCGAISTFIGTTRDNFESKKVLKLEYEAYEPMALKELKNICDKIREKWDVKHIAIFHRLGEVPVCESSVIIAISSAHRQESLQAIQFTIDTLKSNVPIWKKEIYDTEESMWKENKEYNDIIPKSEFPNDCQDDKNEVKLIPDEHVTKKIEVDPDQVQVKADSAELKRRIDSFIFRKRQQVNSVNIQEFCCRRNVNDENENSCARVDAILVRRKDSKSHVKVHRVYNLQGPQTNSIPSARETNQKALEINNPLLDERLSVAEKFLRINKPVPRDIYQRIKNIEDRLLYLESISPEYSDFCNKEDFENSNHHSPTAKRVRF